MPTASTDATSKAGIATSESGERHIPASTRADGSVRKEIKVRPGYRPPEDVELYKNRTAEAWKNRGRGGVPGADFTDSSTPTKTPKKTTKPKQERDQNKHSQPDRKDGHPEVKTAPDPEPVDPEAEKEKEARKLSKKLRQARELQQKKEKGDSLLPEQFEKVIKMNELIRQLDNLGFDVNGERKEP